MEYIRVKGKDMSHKNPTPHSFHSTCWHTNYQQHKTYRALSSLEIWAILAPLQYHLVPFEPNEYNGDRDPPCHHLNESTEREEGSVGWELSLLLALTAAPSKCATKESSHQQGEAWSSAWQCGFFLMYSSLHFKLCSSKKKMRKT